MCTCTPLIIYSPAHKSYRQNAHMHGNRHNINHNSVEFEQLGSSHLGSRQLLVTTRDDVVDSLNSSTSTLPSALSLQLSHATQRYSLSLNWQTNQPLSVLQSVSFSVYTMCDWDATTVEPLYKDTPELRTPLKGTLFVAPSTTPEIRTPLYKGHFLPPRWCPH